MNTYKNGTGTIPFYDGYWYCYSNSTAMLLGSYGYNISPKLIEPLTGVSLGAMFHAKTGLSFFSGAVGEPDVGVTKALEILGFQFKENTYDKSREAFSDLESLLNEGPVVLGPLDMCFLSYNPDRPKSEGVDHYILAYKVENDRVYVNDPAGFSRVYISKDQLEKAWKADGIGYKRGSYRYWASPDRLDTPSEENVYQRAFEWFKELYRKADYEASKDRTLINGKAIRYLSELVQKGGLQGYQENFLTGFALPLGVKRATDYAVFFNRYNLQLSEIKTRQADIFGKAQTLLMDKNYDEFRGLLNQLADIEDEIRKSFI